MINLLLVALITHQATAIPTKRMLQDDDWDDNNPDPPDYNASDYQPIFLNLMLSEGAKVPKDPFFDLPFDDTFGNDHLTPIGENQMYNLGRTILSKYEELFRDTDNA